MKDSLRSRRLGLLLFVACLVASTALAEVDLAQAYPATLEWSEQPRGLDWTVGAQDVWELSEFEFGFHEKLPVKLGPSRAVFGVHEGNVVWAAVFPDEPAVLTAIPTGRAEHITSIWLRFHPVRLGELFPPATVNGRLVDRGSAREAMLTMIDAKRLGGHKLRGSYQAGGRPMLPPKGGMIIDMETAEGPRRFFIVDTDAGTVDYQPPFAKMPLSPAVPMSTSDALATFDEVWEAFDREYAMFTIKPRVDWPGLREEYRPLMELVETSYSAGSIINSMLTHLEDMHVWVKVGTEWLPGYKRERPWNLRGQAIEAMIPSVKREPTDLAPGRTDDGIGYICVFRLAKEEMVEAFDAELEKMADTWGLIIDLRVNGGGSESFAQQISGRFAETERIYSYHQYRDGPDHEDLTPRQARAFQPRGPWRYESPIVVLQGQRTMSSAESFVAMLAECEQVTTMGDHTAGSSGNPRQLELAGGITVNLPRWLDLKRDGTPLDRVGITPDVPVLVEPGGFTDEHDPVLAAAFERLRAIRESERRPGRRSEAGEGGG